MKFREAGKQWTKVITTTKLQFNYKISNELMTDDRFVKMKFGVNCIIEWIKRWREMIANFSDLEWTITYILEILFIFTFVGKRYRVRKSSSLSGLTLRKKCNLCFRKNIKTDDRWLGLSKNPKEMKWICKTIPNAADLVLFRVFSKTRIHFLCIDSLHKHFMYNQNNKRGKMHFLPFTRIFLKTKTF